MAKSSFRTRPNLSDLQFRQIVGSELTLEGINDFVGKLKSKGIEIDGDVSQPEAYDGYVLTYDMGLNKILLKESTGGGGVPTTGLTYQPPSHTFTKLIPTQNLFEVKEVINIIEFRTIFKRGTVSFNNDVEGYRSGLPEKFKYAGPELEEDTEYVAFGSDYNKVYRNDQTIDNYSVILGNINVWTSQVDYLEGPELSHLVSEGYSPLPPGSTSVISIIIEGVYPLFATILNIDDLTKITPLYSMINSNNIEISLVGETNNPPERQKFDVPLPWLNSRPLKGIMEFNEIAQQFQYPGGSQSSSLQVWDVSDTQHNIQGENINYKRYTNTGYLRSAVKIRLVF